MGGIPHGNVSPSRLAVYLLLLPAIQAQGTAVEHNVTEVTSVATVSGRPITEIFTPTSASISGLVPPIKAPTTITTTDDAGQTIAIAVAAGAGVVAGGALAAWMFKLVPGAPPAPTSPPLFSTQSSDTSSNYPTTSSPTPTSSQASACPYPKTGYPLSFASIAPPDQWKAAWIPPKSSTAFSPKCTQQGDNKQLLRGTDPGYINALAQVFCNGDLSKDGSQTLGQADLPDNSSYKTEQLNNIRAKFDFKHKLTNPGCKQNCVDSYSQMALTCQYNSHVLYGGGSLEQGCGIYDFTVDADPLTKLICNPAPNPVSQSYEYRDAAVDAIQSFCTAQDGKSLKQSDTSTNIKQDVFSVTYASDCRGSGTYTIAKDVCVKYLMQALDSCDTQTRTYKHGGTMTDIDNCGAFAFNPTGYDVMACYPKNQDAGYIGGNHVSITPAMAKDAIAQFCDRTGKDQAYTLDPRNIPQSNSFTGDTCTTPGFAECNYFYNNDGSRAPSDSTGDLSIHMSASYLDLGNKAQCPPSQTYEIHGDRCHAQLGKLMGIEPAGNCVGSDPNKLDLGTFIESADKGCVVWNFWATSTR